MKRMSRVEVLTQLRAAYAAGHLKPALSSGTRDVPPVLLQALFPQLFTAQAMMTQ